MNPNVLIPSAACETRREGKGLTSRSEPSSSTSSCQPGNVANARKQMNATATAMNLVFLVRLSACLVTYD